MPSRLAPERTKMVALGCLRPGDLIPLQISYAEQDTPPCWATVRSINPGVNEDHRIVRLNSQTRAGRLVDLCDLNAPPGCERTGCQSFIAHADALIEADLSPREETDF